MSIEGTSQPSGGHLFSSYSVAEGGRGGDSLWQYDITMRKVSPRKEFFSVKNSTRLSLRGEEIITLP